MKKVLLAVCLFGIFSCKDEKSLADAPGDCLNLMVIDKLNFPSTQAYDEWAADKDYIHDVDKNLVFIDMEKVAGAETDDEKRANIKSAWLKAHQDKIFFHESYRYIECTHRVTDQQTLQFLTNVHFTPIKLEEIKAAIKTKNGDYDDDSYDNYVTFKIVGGKIEPDLGTFRFDQQTFSIPFLRAIDEINGIKNSDELFFAEVEDSGNPPSKKRMYIKVKNAMYDFSQEPKKKNLDNSPSGNIAAKATACIDLKDYKKLVSQTEKAAWLEQNGKDVCDDALDDHLEQTHAIPANVSVSDQGKAFEVKCSDLKKITGGKKYDLYLAFKYDSKGEITGLDPIEKFSSANTCYSARFINYLMKGLKDDDVISFTPGSISGKNTVKIELKGKTRPYYDFSQEPAGLASSDPS